MSDTTTERLLQISRDLEDAGFYTSAASVAQVAQQRDALLLIAQEVAILGPGKCSLGKQFVKNALEAINPVGAA